MAYATIEDVTAGMMRDVSEDETRVLTQLLDEVAVLIDAYNSKASVDAKKLVSVRVVRRQIGDGEAQACQSGRLRALYQLLDTLRHGLFRLDQQARLIYQR